MSASAMTDFSTLPVLEGLELVSEV